MYYLYYGHLTRPSNANRAMLRRFTPFLNFGPSIFKRGYSFYTHTPQGGHPTAKQEFDYGTLRHALFTLKEAKGLTLEGRKRIEEELIRSQNRGVAVAPGQTDTGNDIYWMRSIILNEYLYNKANCPPVVRSVLEAQFDEHMKIQFKILETKKKHKTDQILACKSQIAKLRKEIELLHSVLAQKVPKSLDEIGEKKNLRLVISGVVHA